MNPWPVEAEVDEVHLPRPGHADLAGVMKYGHTDVRNVLERASRARDGRARGRRARSPRRYLRALGVSVLSHVTRIGAVDAPPSRTTCGRRTSRASTSRRCAASTPPRARRWWPRSTRPARRTSRSAGCSRCAPSALVPGHRLARLLGGAPRRPAGRGDHVDPGDEGRGDRRRLRRWPGGWARRRTTRSSGRRSRASSARPTAPAGSRAA